MCRNICMFGKNNQILSRILNYSDLDGHSMCTITPKPTKSKFLGFEQSNWVNSSFKPESELFAPFRSFHIIYTTQIDTISNRQCCIDIIYTTLHIVQLQQ